jgi:hypothetical protein
MIAEMNKIIWPLSRKRRILIGAGVIIGVGIANSFRSPDGRIEPCDTGSQGNASSLRRATERPLRASGSETDNRSSILAHSPGEIRDLLATGGLSNSDWNEAFDRLLQLAPKLAHELVIQILREGINTANLDEILAKILGSTPAEFELKMEILMSISGPRRNWAITCWSNSKEYKWDLSNINKVLAQFGPGQMRMQFLSGLLNNQSSARESAIANILQADLYPEEALKAAQMVNWFFATHPGYDQNTVYRKVFRAIADSPFPACGLANFLLVTKDQNSKEIVELRQQCEKLVSSNN